MSSDPTISGLPCRPVGPASPTRLAGGAGWLPAMGNGEQLQGRCGWAVQQEAGDLMSGQVSGRIPRAAASKNSRMRKAF